MHRRRVLTRRLLEPTAKRPERRMNIWSTRTGANLAFADDSFNTLTLTIRYFVLISLKVYGSTFWQPTYRFLQRTLRYIEYHCARPTLHVSCFSDKKWGCPPPLPKQQRSLLEGFGGFSFPVPTLGFR
jgi:hypothetical protein